MAKIIKAAAQAVVDMAGLTAEQIAAVLVLPVDQQANVVKLLRAAVSDSKPRKAKSAEYQFKVWDENAPNERGGKGKYIDVPRDKATHITFGVRKPYQIDRVLDYAKILAS